VKKQVTVQFYVENCNEGPLRLGWDADSFTG